MQNSKTSERQVYGFTLAIGDKCLRITKRLFDVRVGSDNVVTGETPFVLVSPASRSELKIFNDSDLEPEDPKLYLPRRKRDFEIEVSQREWETLKKDGVIDKSRSNSKIQKFLSFNLQSLLKIPGANFDQWQIKAIDEAFIA